MKTNAEMNQANREFWREQSLIRDRLIKKSMVLKKTVELAKQMDKNEPIYSRFSWDYLLQQTNVKIAQMMAERGQKARGVPKADLLTLLIGDLLDKHPGIKENELWYKLRNEKGRGVIIEIERGARVQFLKEDENTGTTFTLKDRLYRARKKDSR